MARLPVPQLPLHRCLHIRYSHPRMTHLRILNVDLICSFLKRHLPRFAHRPYLELAYVWCWNRELALRVALSRYVAFFAISSLHALLLSSLSTPFCPYMRCDESAPHHALTYFYAPSPPLLPHTHQCLGVAPVSSTRPTTQYSSPTSHSNWHTLGVRSIQGVETPSTLSGPEMHNPRHKSQRFPDGRTLGGIQQHSYYG